MLTSVVVLSILMLVHIRRWRSLMVPGIPRMLLLVSDVSMFQTLDRSVVGDGSIGAQANVCGVSQNSVRELNFYTEGEKTHFNQASPAHSYKDCCEGD